MNWKQAYEKWCSFYDLEPELKRQLDSYKNNEEILEDIFNGNLEFGTAGMRGEMGVGTNRLNKYTIRKASEGLARYLDSQGSEAKKRGVVIAYDSRYKSQEFAMEAACTLGAHQITTYVFDSLRPTPELSFAIRHLHTFGGIVITASHNPAEYNGFKVYGEDGGQLPPREAEVLTQYVNKVDDELTIQVSSEDELVAKGLLQTIGEKVDLAYIAKLKCINLDADLINQFGKDIKIVFTPLHGAANMLVQRALKEVGFDNVTVVKEQELPDANFSTVASPNPEEHDAFELAIQYGIGMNAEILLATDPDGDRVGVAVTNDEGEFFILTGNQIGALLLEYLLRIKSKEGSLPKNSVMLKSIVTSELGREIAESFGVVTEDVLTGFKYIAEKIHEYEHTGNHSFLFGYEESYGYLIRDFVRDKDAVQAILLICEVMAYYKSQGMSMYDGLLMIYEKFGFYQEEQVSITLKGAKGAEEITKIMDYFRQSPPAILAYKKVVRLEDYKNSCSVSLLNQRTDRITLPTSNVLKYYCEDGSWFCLRPSGTEPKIKVYFEAKGISREDSEQVLREMKDHIMKKVYDLIN